MNTSQIIMHRQKLVVVFMFLKQYPDKITNLHDMHQKYLEYCRNKITVKYGFGKFFFAGIIQKFGCRRKRTTGPSIWELPHEFDPNDLLELIQADTEKLLNEKFSKTVR